MVACSSGCKIQQMTSILQRNGKRWAQRSKLPLDRLQFVPFSSNRKLEVLKSAVPAASCSHSMDTFSWAPAREEWFSYLLPGSDLSRSGHADPQRPLQALAIGSLPPPEAEIKLERNSFRSPSPSPVTYIGILKHSLNTHLLTYPQQLLSWAMFF